MIFISRIADIDVVLLAGIRAFSGHRDLAVLGNKFAVNTGLGSVIGLLDKDVFYLSRRTTRIIGIIRIIIVNVSLRCIRIVRVVIIGTEGNFIRRRCRCSDLINRKAYR